MIEVDEQSEWEARGSKIGEYLCTMYLCKAFDGLEFDHDEVIDDEIESKVANLRSHVVESDRLLTTEWDLAKTKLVSHRFFVEILQQSRTRR